ncbi:MAG: DNA polymerase III subunit alpha [bacterium]
MKFIHLHNHSHYSLLDGLIKIDQLINRAKEFEMEAVALTDHGNLYGAVEFFKTAKKAGIKPIIGCEMYVANGSRLSKKAGIDTVRYHLVLLVKNEIGYKNLTQLVTKSHLEGFYYKPRIDRELIELHHEGLIALSGCFSGEVARLLSQNKQDEAKAAALFYKDIFGKDYYIELQSHMGELIAPLANLAKELNIPIVATQDTHYLNKEDAQTHAVFLAVQTHRSIGDEKRLNLEKFDLSFKHQNEMIDFFKEYPAAISNTVEIADKCNFEFELGKIIFPTFPVPDGTTNEAYFSKLIKEGTQKRYSVPRDEVKKRLEYEFEVIKRMGFIDYFLIVQDFVTWAKNHGIVVGPGRGSAAGSLVSYVLNITDIDPLEYGLIFERFLNPGRISMPDIDLDFADKRRDEVLGYLKEKYGESCVAQIITFGTMAARAAIRDAGRALGFPYGLCDHIAKLIPFVPSPGKTSLLPTYLETIPDLKKEYNENPDVRKLLDVAQKFEGVTRHASVHACGTVVSEKTLTAYMPLQRSPQDENSIITQFEMHAIEDLGLLKIDLLGLRNLTIIEETVRLVKDTQNIAIDVSNLKLDDADTYAMLQKGETTGVFQFESSGMRRYIKDLSPNTLEDLIALVALYRPGPMELIPTFINRKFGREHVTYLHPSLKPILKNTYGIGVYQEQMMQIARDLGGFTLPEADTLRKSIGKKIKDLLDEQQTKLIDGMIKNGIDKKIAEKIWELFPAFARYGFNRSHAACYALIGYQTAYLKAHFPVEFGTSLLNNYSHDVERISFLVNESKKAGIDVLPPDVNRSTSQFVPEGKNIRFGLAAIKNIGQNISDVIVAERLKGGPYKNLADLLSRVDHRDLNKKSLEALTKTGVFDSIGVERNTILHNIEIILKRGTHAKKLAQSTQTNLFGNETTKIEINLEPAEPATKAERLAWEKELLGFYVTEHPLKEYLTADRVRSEGLVPIKLALLETNDKKRIKICGVVQTVQKKFTKKGDPMIFAKIEDLSDTVEVLVFSDVLTTTSPVWEEGNIIKIAGRVSRKNGEPKLLCLEAKQITI